MSDYFKNTPEIILNGLRDVKKELELRNIEIEIEAAAEYYVDENFIGRIEKNELLTFGDKYVLIESNAYNYSPIIRDAIWELNLNGFKPVYAHPERYSYHWKNFESFSKIKDMGVYFQINLPSLANHYSPTVKKTAELLIKENMVEFIGSDAHEMKYLRSLSDVRFYPIMEQIVKLELLNDTL